MCACVAEEGCRVFVSLNVTHQLVELLMHKDQGVREQAAGALRNLTFKGKHFCI